MAGVDEATLQQSCELPREFAAVVRENLRRRPEARQHVSESCGDTIRRLVEQRCHLDVLAEVLDGYHAVLVAVGGLGQRPCQVNTPAVEKALDLQRKKLR